MGPGRRRLGCDVETAVGKGIWRLEWLLLATPLRSVGQVFSLLRIPNFIICRIERPEHLLILV
jgi:hypothetical protein